jgi:hypothetical protein
MDEEPKTRSSNEPYPKPESSAAQRPSPEDRPPEPSARTQREAAALDERLRRALSPPPASLARLRRRALQGQQPGTESRGRRPWALAGLTALVALAAVALWRAQPRAQPRPPLPAAATTAALEKSLPQAVAGLTITNRGGGVRVEAPDGRGTWIWLPPD